MKTCSAWTIQNGKTLPVLTGVANLKSMYEDFTATDRWTEEPLHCVWKGTVVAIATRHADATDIRFSVNGRPLWIAMPNTAWIEQKRLNGKTITDYLAAQAAGRYLKTSIENGYDNGREMYTMSVEEVLQQVAAVVKEIGDVSQLPSLPVINQDAHPSEMDFKLPGEPQTAAQSENLAPGVTVSRPVPRP